MKINPLALLAVAAISAIILIGLSLGNLFPDQDSEDDVQPGNDMKTDNCGLTPSQPAGPYFVDNMPQRGDIRASTNTGEIEPGVSFQLQISVQTTNCEALNNARVEIWHTNASGEYSALQSRGTDGQDFLRGHQFTNSSGQVIFDTIFPGWYPGRTVHIHFMVITAETSFTSQLYFNQSLADEIYETHYQQHGMPVTSNANDGIYEKGLEMDVHKFGDRYIANYTVSI